MKNFVNKFLAFFKMNNIFYRFLDADDLWFLKEMLFEAIYLPPDEKKKLTPEILNHPQIKLYHENWGRKGDIAIIALDVEKPVGCIWTRLYTNEYPGFGFIDDSIPEVSVALVEEYRGKGIGTKLFELILNECKKSGYSCLSLSVDAVNQSYKLYKRIGFTDHCFKDGTYTMKIIL